VKYLIGVLLILSFGLAGYAQHADVRFLDKSDVDAAKILYQDKLNADETWDKFVIAMRKKYTTPGKDDTCESVIYVNSQPYTYACNWGYGIEFSPDFKAIIPAKQTPTTVGPYYWNNCLQGNFVLTGTN